MTEFIFVSVDQIWLGVTTLDGRHQAQFEYKKINTCSL